MSNALLTKQLRKLAGWFRQYTGMLPEARDALACLLDDAARELEQPEDNGPWTAGVTDEAFPRTYVESNDFTHDVRLYVSGDFGDEGEKLLYAQGIARMLNQSRLPRPFNYKECEIMGDGPVVLWFVQGIDNRWYPTKIVAEQAARITFPDDPNCGYGRVYYRGFTEEA